VRVVAIHKIILKQDAGSSGRTTLRDVPRA
jgi:hypothetical protein